MCDSEKEKLHLTGKTSSRTLLRMGGHLLRLVEVSEK